MGDQEYGVRVADIEDRLRLLSDALAGDGVQLAVLFGSALDSPTGGRDIDLAVLFREYSFERYLELLETVRRILSTRHVDLVVLNRSNAPLKIRALLEGRLIFARTPLSRAEAVTEALLEYEEYRHFMAEYRHHLTQRCREGLSVAARRVDRERVEGCLSILDDAVAQLQRLQGRFNSCEQFQSDPDTRELCVHHLRIALESVLDICRHFLAVVGLNLTELETTNLIELAGEKGLFEPSFGQRIRGMAGMRNAIVHVYWRLDYQAIYGAVTDGLTDLDEFARQIRAYLDAHE